MLTLGEAALERARAELRAVQEAAAKLAIVMARFGEDAEHIASLLRELEPNAQDPAAGLLPGH